MWAAGRRLNLGLDRSGSGGVTATARASKQGAAAVGSMAGAALHLRRAYASNMPAAAGLGALPQNAGMSPLPLAVLADDPAGLRLVQALAAAGFTEVVHLRAPVWPLAPDQRADGPVPAPACFHLVCGLPAPDLLALLREAAAQRPGAGLPVPCSWVAAAPDARTLAELLQAGLRA